MAPAGFGKSSALRDFLESSGIDAVRYDVRREDSTLLDFVHRLSEAIEPAAPTALASFPAMQERVLAGQEPVRQLSDWFTEHLKNTTCTIVIDDLHFAAADPASIALLADVIERSGERIRWIIATRSDVGLPVASWIAYGRMDLPIGEDDLRFTTEEAIAAAQNTGGEIDVQEIESLRQLTEGWPVALTIALRTRTHARDLRTAAFSTRDMVYRYLAEQVFAGLSLPQRGFALATSVLPVFDMSMAEEFGANAAFIRELRAKVAFLNEIGNGEFRYHDLFRDFLESELRRAGEGEWTKAVCHAATLLENRADFAGALSLFAKARSTSDILRVADRHGFDLFERGESARVAGALEIVPEHELASHASAAGLMAMIEAGRGRFSLVEHRFAAAIADAAGDNDLQLMLVHRYALELVRHERSATAFLQPYAMREDLTGAQRAPLLGTLATAVMRDGKYDEAVVLMERALGSADGGVPPDLRARLYQQGAFVYHAGPDTAKTRTYAEAAIRLALAHNLHDVAARAYSALFTIVHNEDDDPVASQRVLDALDEHALKGASSQAHVFALIASYELAAERADDAAFDRLDDALREQDSRLQIIRSETLMPAYALRAAWEGDFRRALSLVQPTLANLIANDRRALRASEIAVYATAAGNHEEAERALDAGLKALDAVSTANRRTVRARCFMALAELLHGREGAANRHIIEAERGVERGMHRLASLVAAVRALHRVALGGERTALQAALERLRAEHLGGIARLIERLPLQAAEGHAFASLTSAERDILQLLAKGASTKEIANATGRSPHTIDTHIRSICRKLDCSGRREAVALASSRGWV